MLFLKIFQIYTSIENALTSLLRTNTRRRLRTDRNDVKNDSDVSTRLLWIHDHLYKDVHMQGTVV
jgi:hypothetical protein